jgi:hypothetical protein
MKTSLASATVLACILAACGGQAEQTKAANGQPENESTRPSASAIQVETDGNTVIERIDLNGDMKPDVFKFYRLVDAPASAVAGEGAAGNVKAAKKALIRKEMDVNFDQRIDIVQYFSGDPSKEVMIREEMDLDFDGRVDSTRHYQDGHVTLVEMDLGFDGRTDTWSYYQLTTGEDGKPVNRLIERRRDNDGDGTVDVWEYYTKGELTKVGTDTNADGTPDQFTRVGEKR